MINITLNFLLILIIVTLAVKVLSFFAPKLKLLDLPNHRKPHKGDVPLIGGIAMFLAFLFGATFLANSYGQIISLLLISFIMLVIGIIDDRSEVSFFPKLFFQVILAVIIVSILGIELKSFGNLFGDGHISLGKASLIISVLAIVGGINSFNVMDGIDGLASGLAIIVFSSVFVIAHVQNNPDIVNLSLLYVFILLPFFFLNLSLKHKIFMGDAGTLFIGTGIVWILIDSSQAEQNVLKPVTALWIFAVPLIDSIAVVLLRIKARKSPFLPDLTHIHHQIIKRRNYSHTKTLGIILTFAASMSIVGVLGQLYAVPEWVMFFSFLCISFGYLIGLKNLRIIND